MLSGYIFLTVKDVKKRNFITGINMTLLTPLEKFIAKADNIGVPAKKKL